MRITAYIHPQRMAITPTGVGKHMIHMVQELARTPDIRLRLFTSRNDIVDGKVVTHTSVDRLPVDGHPMSRVLIEQVWIALGRPNVDRWIEETDWIYCPAEAFVPIRSARLASTVHCVNWFDPELPWYDSPRNRAARRRMRPRWKVLLAKSDLVLCVSEFLKKRITELFGTDPSKIAVVGNGVEDEFFVAGGAPVSSSVANDPYILIVGGLNERKGANYIFPLARELEKRNPLLKIKIAGASDPHFIELSKSNPNIVHCGYQGVDTLPMLLRNAVASVFLSRYETFGIPAIEAMAAGTPSIVSSFAALPEVVGDAGIIADVARPDLIAETILRLSEDGKFREEIIARGRLRAAQFHWSAAAGKLLAAMKNAEN